MNRPNVYEILNKEREYQDERWGGKEHDETHTIGDWIVFMEMKLFEAKKAHMEGRDVDAVLQLRKTTAIGVAALEVLE